MSTEDINYTISGKDVCIKTIAECAYGKVSLVLHNGENLVRKEITYGRKDPNNLDDTVGEIELLKMLDFDNTVEIKDYYIDNTSDMNKIYIYTKYYEYGDLRKLIEYKKEKKEDFSRKDIYCFVDDLVDGLKYIHSREILHRNLKPSNILIGNNRELIISDFGLSFEHEIIDVRLSCAPNYIAPELWSKRPPPYSKASDIFGLGCILYEIYTLSRVFNGANKEEVKEMMNNSENLIFERVNGKKIVEIEELIKGMLEKDPNKRMKLYEIEKKVGLLPIQPSS